MFTEPKFEGAALSDIASAADDSVKAALASGKGIGEFLNSVDQLTHAQQEAIVDQAIALLENFYVHLPLKRAMYGIDPMQRLRLLRRRLATLDSELAFHHEMTSIFTSLRDLHTNYILPTHFARMAAFLPFRVLACKDQGERRYFVSDVVQGLGHATFVPGVRLTHWGGIPIARAVEIAAEVHAGSNAAARHARGVEGLTVRALNLNLPPDEEFVIVGYVDETGAAFEARFDWTVIDVTTAQGDVLDSATVVADTAAGAAPDPLELAMGVDLEIETIQRVQRMLFRPAMLAQSRRIDDARLAAAMASGGVAETVQAAAENAVQGLESTLPKVFQARSETVDGRKIGYLRIHTFAPRQNGKPVDDVTFVNEVVRLIGLLPQDGLLIDVRGNGGGLIWSGERLLQLFTPRTIEPTRYAFVNSPQTLTLAEAEGLQEWQPSLQRAFETAAAFSASFPLTPPERCNDIGQRYYGPVALITDARCYSATDIFAAGFRDHAIGPIIGVDANTGAGGANVWTAELINQLFGAMQKPSPLTGLPLGTSMRVAIRRALRVGPELGTVLEDLGIEPNAVVPLTKRDLFEENVDLIAAAAKHLTPQRSRLNVRRVASDWQIEFDLVDRVDVAFGGRPFRSHDVATGTPLAVQPSAGNAGRLELRGYRQGQLVCCHIDPA